MSVPPNRNILTLRRTAHGGLDYAALSRQGICPDEVLDLSVCVNPFGLSPMVREALKRPAVDRYPDSRAAALRERLAALQGLEPGQVLAANGASQGIWLIAMAYIRPADTVLVVSPGFGEYSAACELMGARVLQSLNDEQSNFRPCIETIAERVRNMRPRLVWLGNPNNPTGHYLAEAEAAPVLEACMEAGSLLILDEAYINFVAGPWRSKNLIDTGHLILLRSMTKDFALPGLRLGYLLASAGSIAALSKAQPPWSINAVAQEAGLAALESLDYYRAAWNKLRKLTEELADALISLGFRVFPTRANFILLRCQDRRGLQEHLWKRRILVRDCTSFGLPEFIRVGTRREEDNRRFLAGVKDFLKEGAVWEG